MKNVMYAVFFRSTGFVNAIKLDGRKTGKTAKWYIEKCLPEVFNRAPDKGILLHHDNASSYMAVSVLQFLTEENIKVIEHPPYSSDLAMCDFWLFFRLKRILRFSSEEEIDTSVHAYFEVIQTENWLGAFKQWRKRMVKCFIAEGNYFKHT